MLSESKNYNANTRSGENTYLQGTLQWKDDRGVTHPLRRIMVDIFDYDGVLPDPYLGTAYTDQNGKYSFAFKNSTSIFENGGYDIYIRAYAGDNITYVVKNEAGTKYWWESYDQGNMNVSTGSTTNINMTIDMTSDLGRAFQISQALITAKDFAWIMYGYEPPKVTTHYPTGNNCNYNSNQKRIRITSKTRKNENYPHSYASWDTIMHEYGHHIQYDQNITSSPGNAHWFGANMIDHYYTCDDPDCKCAKPNSSQAKLEGIRIAWAEAWPTVFGTIAQNYWSSSLENIMTVNDSYYTSYNGLNIDIDEPPVDNGDGCEFSIMAVLWDMYDSGSETNDTIALGYQSWWDITTGGGDKTFSSFMQRFYSSYPQYKYVLGNNLSYYQMAPSKVNPYSTGTALSLSPPNFNWWAQGGSINFPNNSFILKIYGSEDETLSLSLLTTSTNITLSNAQWNTVLGWPGEKIRVAVTGYQTSNPTTGGYVSEYREYTKPIYKTSTKDGNVTITGVYYQLSGTIIIPSTLYGMPVVAIGAQAFKNHINITGVTMPSSITSIGNRAFQFCYKLAAVYMSYTSVTRLEDYTFDTCAISSINLPNTITYIGEGVFIRAGNIQTIPSNVTTIGDYAFANTTSTILLIPTTITNVGFNAFLGCDNLTIYTSHTSKPSTWNAGWNSSNRPIIWGASLSSNYVISFNKTLTNPSNSNATNGINNPYRSGHSFGGWYTASDYSGTQYMNINSAPNGMLYAKWTQNSCVIEGTLITLADGSQKPVEEFTGNEQLLVWNLLTGTFDFAPILFIDSDAESVYEVINLVFSDGTSVKVISEHGFWNENLNKYVFLRNDAAKYIGHWFNKQTTDANGDMTWTAVQLTSVVVANEITTAWSPVTYDYLCYYVNGMLSMPGGTTGLINIFDVNAETMQYDQESMQADIAEYGLFTYEEFNEIFDVPEMIFQAFNGQYLKVAIGKGLITIDELAKLIENYSKFFYMES